MDTMTIKRGAPAASGGRNRPERLQRELNAAGSLLADAVALEQHFVFSRRPSRESLVQRQMCRRTLRPLVRDYCRALARYEKALRNGFRRSRISR